MDFKKLQNKVLIVDYHNGPIVYETNRENNRTIFKGNTLNKSIRQLLNAKVKSMNWNLIIC